NTSVEYYCTIFAAAESPHEKGVLWCGSDDGLIHVSRDGGAKWTNITPPDLPEWAQINSIEPHPFEKGGLYVAATRYKLDDFRPYLYRTTDYGKTWKKIVAGIPDQHFTRVIRADPKRPGLLYAGTEQGMYVSFDDGQSWQSLQLNLPIVPITDLALKNDDLIVATQDLSFWGRDDLTVLHQYTPEHAQQPVQLYTPRPAYRLGGGSTDSQPKNAGQNPPNGAVVYFHLKEAPTSKAPLTLALLDAQGNAIRKFSTQPKGKEEKLSATAGMNRFVWDLRYPKAEDFPGMVLWGGMPVPRAVPDTYQVEVQVGDQKLTVPLKVLPDPRTTATTADMQEQFGFVVEVRDKLTEVHRAIRKV